MINHIYDPIGPIAIEPAEYDENGNEVKATIIDHRYHVNSLVGCCPEIPEEYIVAPTPNYIRRFAGVPIEDHVFLRFPDKATAESYFGIDEIPVED